MMTISTDQIETQPHEFVARLTAGEDIVIVKGNVPVALVTGIRPRKRISLYGNLAGRMKISSDFDEPLGEFENI